nr:alpha/beta hydrolase [uncultured Cohaesibacter sp.]
MTSTDLYAKLGDIRMCYRQDGSSDAPALILIPGLGMQLIEWPSALVEALSQDHRVIRLDNRDCGLSSRCGGPFSALPSGFSWKGSALEQAPYDLTDMADDVIALANHLQLKQFGCIGFSMGGMIAQIVATKADDRVRSLVSISSTGGESVISAEPEALRQMESFFFPFATAMEALKVIRSSNDYFSRGALPRDSAQSIRLAHSLVDRAHDEGGYLRQAWAMTATPGWRDGLAKLLIPALFLHGDKDPCIKAASAQQMAGDMYQASCTIYPELGHWIDDQICAQIVSWINGNDIAPSNFCP